MNENHQRHLAVTFRYIDTLLGEVERIFKVNDASPFVQYIHDASLPQRQAVDSQIPALRVAMLRIMSECGIPLPEPTSSSLWAARGIIGAARIALAEMQPKVMRGYGPLTDIDIERVEAIVAELDGRLGRLDASLVPGASSPQ